MSTKSKKRQLPSIQQLIEDSWELFKKTWVAYLKLIGLTIAYVFLSLLIGVIISLPITFVAIGSHLRLFNHLTPFTIGTIILFALWCLLFLLSLIAIEIIFPIVSIFILQGKKTTSLFELIKQAKKFFWPYFFAVLLSGLAAAGGMILLIIPGLLFAFFFAFTAFEIVVEGQVVSSALRRSYFMITTHFWEVLGRLVVLEVAIIIVSSLLQRIAAADALVGLVQFLFTLFVSFYARAYAFLLYKEVRAATTFPQKISIRWIWTVSAVGWVVIILLLIGLVIGVAHVPGMMHPHHRYNAPSTPKNAV